MTYLQEPVWRPIKTALTEGKPAGANLMLFDPEGIGVFVGYYGGPDLGWRPLCASTHWQPDPSHWMPLPAPPQGTDAA